MTGNFPLVTGRIAVRCDNRCFLLFAFQGTGQDNE